MKFKHRLEYFFYLLFSGFARLFGFNRISIPGKLIGLLFYYFIPIRKKVVIRNLRTAFPDKSESEIRDIAKRNYISFAVTFLEIAVFYYADEKKLNQITDYQNLDKIKDKLAPSPNGTILLTAHFGNWELGALAFGLWLNTPISVLAKKQKNSLVAARIKQIREKFGNREVLLGTSVRDLYGTLKRGGYIGVVGDQRAPRDSIRVNYFGIPTAVFPGTASLALKLKPPIFTVLLRRMENNKYIIEVEEIGYDNLPQNPEEAQIELTQRYIDILEQYVRMNPEQWFWMHNIWKH